MGQCSPASEWGMHWRSQGGKVMWALLGHIVKGKGNAAKQSRIRAFRIIYTWARTNLTWEQARVCPGLTTPLEACRGRGQRMDYSYPMSLNVLVVAGRNSHGGKNCLDVDVYVRWSMHGHVGWSESDQQ